MSGRKKKNLVIVESPAKARTINKYLGPDYEVVASKGHVRDLPKTRFGIDIENGWVPTYRPLKDRKDVLDSLKKQAAKAGLVYLAPDPDREGEAIAWHLKEALGLDDERTRRVTFNEITKNAVQKAFKDAGQIDMDRVAAQEARRFLDRVVGYKISPLLSRRLTETLSAGRVQSVAVRLIVEREREIQGFKPEEFWKIAAILRATLSGRELAHGADRPAAKTKSVASTRKPKVQKPLSEGMETSGEDGAAKPDDLPEGAFVAELTEWAGGKFKAGSQGETDSIVKALEGAHYLIAKVEQKDRQEKAPPPFTTSTLQQQASIRLRYSAKRTMMLAQRLYEGVELGEDGPVALITYMRTDSTRVAPDALAGCREHIKQKHGPRYVPEKPNYFSVGKGAQDAHEAVRPTDLSYAPEKVAKYLEPHQLRLYTLIYQRFVASQMTPAEFAITTVEVSAAQGIFKAQGKVMKFDGYRRVLAPGGKQEDALLPTLTEKQALDLLKLNATQHFTEPPSRFNEASLVRTLEKEGIGRPSTYAAIISKIQDRGYVELKERRFYATTLGMTVTDLLVEHFPRIMDPKFTSHMEEELDDIETRKYQRNDVLNEFYVPFELALREAEGKLAAEAEKCPECSKALVERFSRFGKFFGCSGHPECNYIKRGSGPATPREPPKVTDIPCPNCNKLMVQRMSRRGPFLGCSGYPDCKTTMNLDPSGKPVVTARPTDHVCDKCGKQMVLREGPRGPFLACTGYPKCRRAMDVDAEGNPVKPIDTGINCEKCGSPMAVKRGPRGPFLGCTAYPKCRSTKQVPDALKDKVKDLMPTPRKKLPKVEVTETCPECGSAMELRQGRRGYFLGCTTFRKSKCKGTREATPEIISQLQTAAT